MKTYQAMAVARNSETLNVVARVQLYAHNDRLRVEKMIENAGENYQFVFDALTNLMPGVIVTAEMGVNDRLVDALWLAYDALEKSLPAAKVLPALERHHQAYQAAREALQEMGVVL